MIPVTENSTHINDDYKVNELINMIVTSPADIEHLQVFLGRDDMSNRRRDYEYLMISQNVFGKVRVLDLLVNGDYVTIEFLDVAMQELGYIQVYITDKNPRVLFVNWQDIRKIVQDDNATNFSTDTKELLDFDFYDKLHDQNIIY